MVYMISHVLVAAKNFLFRAQRPLHLYIFCLLLIIVMLYDYYDEEVSTNKKLN